VTLDQPAPPPVAPTQAGITVAEPPRRRWGVLAAVAAVVVVAAAAGLLLARGLGGGVSRAEAIATLDRYQVSLTNADLPALEKLLAPGFERKLLADPPGDRATALKAFRAAFDVRGTQPRFSLKDVRVETADGGATATARYSYTAGGDPHPGDYGANTFHMVERDGKVLIDRIETYPDVVALLPPSLKSSDFPLEVSLTATLAARGESVPIAKATSRLERRPDAVVVPLTKTGRRIVHSGQDYEVHMKLTLADGRPLTVATTTNHFISGAGPAQP
jgi:hypothetical protein